MATTLPRRDEVPTAHTWDTASIFADLEAWETAYREVETLLPRLAAFRDHLGDSAASLLDWMQTYDNVSPKVTKIYIYAHMLFDTDTLNQSHAALMSRAYGLIARFQAACAFAEPELLALDSGRLEQFMTEKSELRIYAHYIEDLQRQRAHVRSAEVEEILAQVGEPLTTAWSAYQVLADGDMTFVDAHDSNGQAFEVAQGTIIDLLASRDRALRLSAWHSFFDGFLNVKNTMATLFAGNVKTNTFHAQVRGYPNALTASLSVQNIPTAVYEGVVSTCINHLPLWHRYWELRRRALGLEKVESCDVFAPLAKYDPPISYQESVDIICAGMAPLGDEYVSDMRTGLTEQRWVDIYPNQGKRGGAYSTGSYGTHPFILMSYTDGLQSLSTLAHEIGHSMHSYLTNKHQPFVYSRYSLFAAEVASNFNQALVRSYLLDRQPDRDFQIALIEEAMMNFHRYFFMMPILAQFELQAHQRIEQGQALTADIMSNMMAELLRRGYGPAGQIDEARDGITWATFPHMYMNFYVYQYASGIAAATALADRVLAGEQDAAKQYLRFLSAGDSCYPLDALHLAGIDMTSPEPIERAFKVLERFIDKLEQLLA